MSRGEWGRGSVYERAPGKWMIRYPDGTGKQRYESAGPGANEAKAQRLLERRLLELENGNLPAKAKERKRTVNELLDDLEADYKARQRRSAYNLISVLKPVRLALGELRASTITTAKLTQYIISARAKYADESIGRQLRHLRQAFGQQSAIPIPKFPPLPRGQARDVLIRPAEQLALGMDSTHPYLYVTTP